MRFLFPFRGMAVAHCWSAWRASLLPLGEKGPMQDIRRRRREYMRMMQATVGADGARRDSRAARVFAARPLIAIFDGVLVAVLSVL